MNGLKPIPIEKFQINSRETFDPKELQIETTIAGSPRYSNNWFNELVSLCEVGN